MWYIFASIELLPYYPSGLGRSYTNVRKEEQCLDQLLTVEFCFYLELWTQRSISLVYTYNSNISPIRNFHRLINRAWHETENSHHLL